MEKIVAGRSTVDGLLLLTGSRTVVMKIHEQMAKV
jgi:hypothetical protein